MNINKAYAYGSSIAVVTVVLVGLMLSGSPAQQRLLRFDEQRQSDLQRLSYDIGNYFDEHQSLPMSLETLIDGKRVSELPRDPESNTLYTYAHVNETKYRLCADFKVASDTQEMGSFWSHEAGYYCFQLDNNPAIKQGN